MGCHSFSLNSKAVKASFSPGNVQPEPRPLRSSAVSARNLVALARWKSISLQSRAQPEVIQRWKSVQECVDQQDLPGAQGRQSNPSQEFARPKSALTGFTEPK